VIDLRHGDYRRVLADVTCDALIVDAPYSTRTHSGHGTERRHGTSVPPGYDDSKRRAIGYEAWSAADVRRFVEHWSPRTRGWMVSITDHVLEPAWSEAMRACGRMVFAPLPFFSPGSRVRLAGDGPSSWTTWIVVARPSRKEFLKWGTLPGGYQGSTERGMEVVGAKPLWLMRELVRDYSRPGDLVCDPCAGGATTLLAAAMEGRDAIGAERSYATAELAAARIERALAQQSLFTSPAVEPVQEGLAL
jgi:site-specific DNA-methyltransferase (adenine-specific)